MIRDEIILLGPMGAGKSTISNLLGHELNKKVVQMDDLRAVYYPKQGLTKKWLNNIERNLGFLELYYRCKEYELVMVEEALKDHQGCIFDFGAGHASFYNEKHIKKINKLLCNFPNTFLLLPSPDFLTSMLHLNRMSHEELDNDRLQVNKLILLDKNLQNLASHTIYTADSTPEVTTLQILELLKL
jgi:shikimate kinase